MKKSYPLKILYFILGFLTSFLILLLYQKHIPTPQVPVIIQKTKIIKDTIKTKEFHIIELPETLKVEKPLLWKLWTYEDSIIKIEFESPAFRNFIYSLKLPQYQIIYPEKIKEKYGELFLMGNWEKLNLGIGYKFLNCGIEFNLKSKKFLPLIGLRFVF